MAVVRVSVRVRPGSSRTRVGGTYAEGALLVAVTAPPVDGAANEAVVKAVAAALGLRPARVTVAGGHTSRSKVLALDVDDVAEPDIRARVLALLGD